MLWKFWSNYMGSLALLPIDQLLMGNNYLVIKAERLKIGNLLSLTSSFTSWLKSICKIAWFLLLAKRLYASRWLEAVSCSTSVNGDCFIKFSLNSERLDNWKWKTISFQFGNTWRTESVSILGHMVNELITMIEWTNQKEEARNAISEVENLIKLVMRKNNPVH